MVRKRASKTISNIEYDDEPVVIPKIEKKHKLVCKTKNQQIFKDTINANILTICSSVAGVGKTHVSLGVACEDLLTGKIDKIIISRPVVQCGPGVGFLSGSLEEKLAPFMKNVLSICEIFLGPTTLKKFIDDKTIEIEAIETMRGNTYENSFMILDEFQNCSYEMILMWATRIGEGSKAVISGDLDQIDNFRGPYASGAQRFYDEQKRSEGLGEDIGFSYFEISDIVRSKIVKTILMNCRIAKNIRENENR